MDESAQAALLGSTEEQWFIEEDERNVGANYLKGLCYAFVECIRPFSIHADELRATILAISHHLEPSYWNFKSLAATPEWRHARCVARELLRLDATRVTPPREPFKIERLIHVEEYQHASTIRAQSKRGKR